MRWIKARRRRAPIAYEQAVAKWDSDRRDDADLDAVELYLPVATPIVFRGLDQRVVVTRALAWLRRHATDFRILGLTWWTEEARDPRADREGDHLFRHTLTVHVTAGGPGDEVDWGRDT